MANVSTNDLFRWPIPVVNMVHFYRKTTIYLQVLISKDRWNIFEIIFRVYVYLIPFLLNICAKEKVRVSTLSSFEHLCKCFLSANTYNSWLTNVSRYDFVSNDGIVISSLFLKIPPESCGLSAIIPTTFGFSYKRFKSMIFYPNSNSLW
jgi:hypothetical protein